jgi:hypothetical protein
MPAVSQDACLDHAHHSFSMQEGGVYRVPKPRSGSLVRERFTDLHF